MKNKNHIIEILIQEAIKSTFNDISNSFLILEADEEDTFDEYLPDIETYLDSIYNAPESMFDTVLNMFPDTYALIGAASGLGSSLVSVASNALTGIPRYALGFAQGLMLAFSGYSFYQAGLVAGRDNKIGFYLMAVILGTLGLIMMGYSLFATGASLLTGGLPSPPDPPETALIIQLAELVDEIQKTHASFSDQLDLQSLKTTFDNNASGLYELDISDPASVKVNEFDPTGGYAPMPSRGPTYSKAYQEAFLALLEEMENQAKLTSQTIAMTLAQKQVMVQTIEAIDNAVSSRMGLDRNAVAAIRKLYITDATKLNVDNPATSKVYSLKPEGVEKLKEVNLDLATLGFQLTEVQFSKLVMSYDTANYGTSRKVLLDIAEKLTNYATISDKTDIIVQDLAAIKTAVKDADGQAIKLSKFEQFTLGLFQAFSDVFLTGKAVGDIETPMTFGKRLGMLQGYQWYAFRDAMTKVGNAIEAAISKASPEATRIPVKIGIPSDHPLHGILKGMDGFDAVNNTYESKYYFQILDGEPVSHFSGVIRGGKGKSGPAKIETKDPNGNVIRTFENIKKAEDHAKLLWDQIFLGDKTAIAQSDSGLASIPLEQGRKASKCDFQLLEQSAVAAPAKGAQQAANSAAAISLNGKRAEYNSVIKAMYISQLDAIVGDARSYGLINGQDFAKTKDIYKTIDANTSVKRARKRVQNVTATDSSFEKVRKITAAGTKFAFFFNFIGSNLLPFKIYGVNESGDIEYFDVDNNKYITQDFSDETFSGDSLTIDIETLENAPEITEVFNNIIKTAEEIDEEVKKAEGSQNSGNE